MSADKGQEKPKGKAPEKKAKEKTANPKKNSRPLPIFLETIFSLARAAIIISCLAVAGISFLSGATWLDVFIRTGATLLGLGSIMWLLATVLTSGSIEARQAIAKQNGEEEKSKSDHSTLEINA